MNGGLDDHTAMARWRADALDTVLHKVGKLDAVMESQRKIEASLDKLADAVSKLAVIEERQNTDRMALERAFAEIAKLQERQDADADKHASRIETAINNVSKSIERVHTRFDEVNREMREDLEGLGTRLGAVEVQMPETNRLKEWGFEAVKMLAIAGVSYYISRGGV